MLVYIFVKVIDSDLKRNKNNSVKYLINKYYPYFKYRTSFSFCEKMAGIINKCVVIVGCVSIKSVF